MIRTTAVCLAAIAGLANAGTVVLDIDQSESSINVTATLATPVGTDTDNGSSSVSGTIEIELDDYGTPTAITLHDFIIIIDDDIALNFDYGFLGDASATLIDAMAMYGTPGIPAGPVSIAGSSFSFPDVPAELAGNADYSYDFFLVGSGSDSIVLADLGLFSAPISGDVTSDGEHVTLSGDLDFDVTEELLDGTATLNLTGTASLVAAGDAPDPGGCNPADLAEPFNVLDLADIAAFVTAFGNQQPPADLAPPAGVFDLADIAAFTTAFTAGCP